MTAHQESRQRPLPFFLAVLSLALLGSVAIPGTIPGAISEAMASENPQPRFVDNEDGTVTDHVTGLTWLRHASAFGQRSWNDAMATVESLSADAFDWLDDGSEAGDWRLPDYHEMLTFTNTGIVGATLPADHPFDELPGRRGRVHYWSSSEGAYDAHRAWRVQPNAGGRASFDDKSNEAYVWAVRGELKGLPEHLGPVELHDDFESLTEREQQRAELNALWDFRQLRRKDTFVVEETDAFLDVPDALAAWYPSDRYTVAEHAPRVKLQMLPNIEPEYFPEGEAYASGWANWAKVTRSEDNRFYMAASDHRGRGAKINIYVYQPEGNALERALDVSETLGWHMDMHTDGKIHGYMGIMDDGTLWAATHRGPTVTQEWYDEGYRGSWLLSYNIHTGEATNWGVPLVGNSLPYFRLDTERGIFFGSGENDTLLAWDVNEKRVRFAGYPPNGWDWWQVSVQLCDVNTGVFWGMDMSEEPYRFLSFDPEVNRFERHDLEVPRHPVTGEQGRFTHNTKVPDADGWYYAVAANGTFFRFRPDGEDGPEAEALAVTSGETGGTVHQVVLCPDRRFVYYVPRRRDAMIVKQYDIKTGEHKALGFLTEHILRNYGYSVGRGIYGVNVSDDGSFLVILENGAFGGRDSGFGGHPAVLVVEIPKAERRVD